MLKMSFMIGMVVFGNLTDNVSQPKYILFISQIAIAICWALTGALVHYSSSQTYSEQILNSFVKPALFQNLNFAQFFASAILLLTTLQISNWVTRKNINKILALFFLTQFAAYSTPLDWVEDLYSSVTPVVYYTCSAGFALITVVDFYFWAFHPLEKNIFLDQERVSDR